MKVLDLFAGAGGFSLGAHAVTDDVTGFELNADACATQRAAGMQVQEVDIRRARPGLSRSDWHRQGHLHLHASPPCTTFSAAGKGHGRNSIDVLGQAAYDIVTVGFTNIDLSDVDDTTKLVLEPARWIFELLPESISFEQVRAVLPIWDAYHSALEGIGYSGWTAILHAEQYGVPQTRQRAWLGARKGFDMIAPPAPTHSHYHQRDPKRLDPDVLPWVSMAEALGFAGPTGFPRRSDNGDVVTIEGVDYRARDLREASAPAFNLTEKARSWTHYAPAGVSQKSHPAKPRQLDEAPAPTVTSVGNHYLFNPEVDTFGEDLVGANARKITVAEAGVLQGFPADYPWQGTRTSQFRQVGNAVPPPVAEAVLRSVL